MAFEGLAEVPVKRLMLLLGVILVGAAYFSYSFLIQPLKAEADTQQTAINDLRTRVEAGRIVETQLPQFRAELERQRQRLQQFKANLPNTKETPQLMRRIQNLAINNNLNIKAFEPQQVVQQQFYADWPIQISLDGNFHNLGNFFEGISQMSRLVNINDLSIQTLEGSTNRDRTIAATCTATTFVFLVESGASE